MRKIYGWEGLIRKAPTLSLVVFMVVFQASVNCDIIPCKAGGFVLQKQRFGLGNLI
jgi:hypothetical protein